MIKYIVSDIDNTLMLEGKSISKKLQTFLESLVKSGVKLILNTSRPFCMVDSGFIRPIKHYTISNNGSEIHNTRGEMLYLKTFTKKNINILNKVFNRTRVLSILFTHGNDYSPVVYTDSRSLKKYYLTKYSDTNITVLPLVEGELILPIKTNFISVKFNGVLKNKDLKQIDSIADVKKSMNKFVLRPLKITKLSGVFKLFKLMQWPIEKNAILALGDSEEDDQYLHKFNGYYVK